MNWISVNSSLPKNNERILVYYDQDVHIMLFLEQCHCDEQDHFVPSFNPSCFDTDIIEYWQPLPKAPPPKEKEIRITTKKRRPLNNSFNTPLKKPRAKSAPNKFNFWG